MTTPPEFLQAFRGDTTGPVPSAPLYMSLFLEPRRRRHLVALYRSLAAGADEVTLTFETELEVRLEAWTRAWAELRPPPDWMSCGHGPTRAAVEGARVVFREDQCLWFPPGADEPTLDLAAENQASSHDIWDSPDAPHTVADVEARIASYFPGDYLADGQGELPSRMLSRFGSLHCLYTSTPSPWWLCYETFGFSGLMENLRLRPELLEAACWSAVPHLLELAAPRRTLGFPVMFIEECLSGSDLLSPTDYARFVWPPLREFMAGLTDLGFLVVHYHCGGIHRRLDLLAEAPVAALAFEESKKGFLIDLGEIRRALGPEKTLFGNLDTVLLRDGSPSRIRAEVERQYEAAGPRFVVSLGSPATLDTPPEKVALLTEIAASLR